MGEYGLHSPVRIITHKRNAETVAAQSTREEEGRVSAAGAPLHPQEYTTQTHTDIYIYVYAYGLREREVAQCDRQSIRGQEKTEYT